MIKVQSPFIKSILALPLFQSNDSWGDTRQAVLKYVLGVLPLVGLTLILAAYVFPDPLYGGLLGLILLVLPFPVNWVSQRSYWGATSLLLSGLLITCQLALQWSGVSAAACLLVVPVFLSVILVGPAGGALTGAVSAVALSWDSALGIYQPTDFEHALILFLIWTMVLLPAITRQPVKMAIIQSRADQEHISQLLEEARDRQLELAQIRQSLEERTIELAGLSDRLRVMRQIAEDARVAKEQFVANVSHELRTPLNMIIGFSELIVRSPHLYGMVPQALLADIEAVQRNSEHLASMVDDILDLSKFESERMILKKEPVSLPDLLTNAASLVRSLYDSKGLYLRVKAPSDLPLVCCDGNRIRQVILNLLSNAARFVDHGGVEMRTWREKAKIWVSVTDTGTGIAPEDHARIFEPFSQVDSSPHRRSEGAGLGLRISKAIVELHQGKIWVESELGKGTTFLFTLPLNDPVQLQSSASRWINPYLTYNERTRPPAPPMPEIKPRFVVVDQQDSLRYLAERHLDGSAISSVNTIEEALREIGRSPAQALIVNDPTESEADARMMPQAPDGTPTFTCWLPGKPEISEGLGIFDYLTKPVTSTRLLSALAKLGESVRTLLLVDDEPEVLRLFGRMISASGRGYRLLRASDGERALTMLRERRPDAMLLDLVMPGLDGFGVLALKNKDAKLRDIPVIVVSAQDHSDSPPTISSLTVSRVGGLSAHELLTCIQTISNLLKPAGRVQQ
ncbi:MAG: hybrid sensor histidine kinase/response regulator [Chloroflexi bacterium]|nr:hybrid sensor histidine kinase/response regulator [Chloroflexota bacterium]